MYLTTAVSIPWHRPGPIKKTLSWALHRSKIRGWIRKPIPQIMPKGYYMEDVLAWQGFKDSRRLQYQYARNPKPRTHQTRTSPAEAVSGSSHNQPRRTELGNLGVEILWLLRNYINASIFSLLIFHVCWCGVGDSCCCCELGWTWKERPRILPSVLWYSLSLLLFFSVSVAARVNVNLH